jgi:nitrous oxidase accessory protein NosD
MSRGAARAGVLLAALLLAACSGGGSDGSSPPPGAASSAASPGAQVPAGTPPTPPPSPPAAAVCDPAGAVEVRSAAELETALAAAAPGATIHLADGTYGGNFVGRAQGAADRPITLCGGRGAVLDGGDVDGGYTLHLDGAAHWQLLGFTISGGQKGLMVDAGVGNLVEGLLVHGVGDEAIHLRKDSTDNVVRGNTVRDTGLRKPKFGEGVYVGTAESNWSDITGGRPDHSDRNVVEGNDIAQTTAESVDVKEGTSDGVVRGNRFDGTSLDDDAADSWVDVKGNGWLVEGNTGAHSPEDGFQVHEVVDGWGRGTVFRGNTAAVDGPGYGIHAAGSEELRASTTVTCDNTATGAASGLSNVDCRS